MADAKKLVSDLKGLDSSGVEVEEDEEQTAPAIAAGSAEEASALAQMEELVQASGDKEAIAADQATKLLCLRGRKYDAARAAEVLPKFLALKKEVGYGTHQGAQYVADLKSHKVMSTGAKDADGRGVIWVRLRFHNPKESKSDDMVRLITSVMLSALEDVDVQRKGLTVIQDMTGLSLKNLDPQTAKAIFGKVFPNLPIRVGRICIYNPPWVLGHVVIPIMLNFLSKKLRGRIAVLNGEQPAKLLPYVPAASLPPALGGTYALDEDKWSEAMLAKLGVK